MAKEVDCLEIKGIKSIDQFTGDTGKDYHISNNKTTIPLSDAGDWITKHKLNSVGHRDEEDSGEFTPTDDIKLIVTDDEEEEVVRSVSNNYNLVQNEFVVSILQDVIEDFNLENLAFGRLKSYRNSVYVDLYIDHEVTRFSTRRDIDGDEKIVGVQISAGTDRSTSISSTPFILDESIGARLVLDDAEGSMKHTKSKKADRKEVYSDIYEMIATGIISTGYLSEELIRDVHRASKATVDFEEYDFNVVDFYEEWLPSQVSQKAIDGAVMMSQHRAGEVSKNSDRVVDNATLSAWEIVTGFTWSLANRTNMSDGNILDSYHKKARKALSRPEDFIDRVIESLEEKMEEREEKTSEEELLEKARTTQRELSYGSRQARLNTRPE